MKLHESFNRVTQLRLEHHNLVKATRLAFAPISTVLLCYRNQPINSQFNPAGEYENAFRRLAGFNPMLLVPEVIELWTQGTLSHLVLACR